jgi:hypothetical protein
MICQHEIIQRSCANVEPRRIVVVESRRIFQFKETCARYKSKEQGKEEENHGVGRYDGNPEVVQPGLPKRRAWCDDFRPVSSVRIILFGSATSPMSASVGLPI